MKHDMFECDGCGKQRERGPDVIGWFDMAEVVLATRKDQPRWQFCSAICLGLFALAYKPGKVQEEEPVGSLLQKWQEAFQGHADDAPIGQYL